MTNTPDYSVLRLLLRRVVVAHRYGKTGWWSEPWGVSTMLHTNAVMATGVCLNGPRCGYCAAARFLSNERVES